MERLRLAFGVIAALGTAVIAHASSSYPSLLMFDLAAVVVLVWGAWPTLDGLFAGAAKEPDEPQPQIQLEAKFWSGAWLRVTNLGLDDRFRAELRRVRYDGKSTVQMKAPLTWSDTEELEQRIGPGLTAILELPEPQIKEVSGVIQSEIMVPWPPGSRSGWGEKIESSDGSYRVKWAFDIRVVAVGRVERRDVRVHMTMVRQENGRTRKKDIEIEDIEFE